MWQSEIKGCSVVYFYCITAFKTLHCLIPVKGEAHTCFMDHYGMRILEKKKHHLCVAVGFVTYPATHNNTNSNRLVIVLVLAEYTVVILIYTHTHTG